MQLGDQVTIEGYDHPFAIHLIANGDALLEWQSNGITKIAHWVRLTECTAAPNPCQSKPELIASG